MVLDKLIISSPSLPWLLKIIPAINLTIAVISCAMEARGKNLQYSKLRNSQSKHGLILVPAKLGMFIAYAPSLLFGMASLFLFPDEGMRFLVLRLAVTLHFLKRVLEVMFIHKFSGSMALTAVTTIPTGYLILISLTIYTQHACHESPQPAIDLTFVGLALFLVGISGNFYHHYLLSTLRSDGGKGYKIPQGGFFSLVICPHYFFEALCFWAIAFISQTAIALSGAVMISGYLVGRSLATRRWYVSKFEEFPRNVKAIVPYAL